MQWALLVTDSGGKTATQSFGITVANTNDAPSFTSTPVLVGAQGAPYVYQVTTTDTDVGDTRAITATQIAGWLALTDHGNGTATLSGTPGSLDVGGNTIKLRVIDAGGAVGHPDVHDRRRQRQRRTDDHELTRDHRDPRRRLHVQRDELGRRPPVRRHAQSLFDDPAGLAAPDRQRKRRRPSDPRRHSGQRERRQPSRRARRYRLGGRDRHAELHDHGGEHERRAELHERGRDRGDGGSLVRVRRNRVRSRRRRRARRSRPRCSRHG